MPPNSELQSQINFLKNEIETIRYLLNKKTGGGPADIKGKVVAPSVVVAASVSYEQVTVNVAAAATTGTGTATSGSVIIGWRPAGNVDQVVDSIAISGTTVTVTLGVAATAINNFVVILLKA